MRIAQHKQRSRHRHLGVGVGVGTDLGVDVGVGTGIDMRVGVGVSLGWGSDGVTVGDGVTGGEGVTAGYRIVFIFWVPVANTRWKLVLTNASASLNGSTFNLPFFKTSLFPVPPTTR